LEPLVVTAAIEPDTRNHHCEQQRKATMPIMPPQDDRDDLDCQEALEVEFQAHAGVALLQLLEDAKSVGWPEAEARKAIMRLIEVHLNSERHA
jgi:hypothetical protein